MDEMPFEEIVTVMRLGGHPPNDGESLSYGGPVETMCFGKAIFYLQNQPSSERWRYSIATQNHGLLLNSHVQELQRSYEFQQWLKADT